MAMLMAMLRFSETMFDLSVILNYNEKRNRFTENDPICFVKRSRLH